MCLAKTNMFQYVYLFSACICRYIHWDPSTKEIQRESGLCFVAETPATSQIITSRHTDNSDGWRKTKLKVGKRHCVTAHLRPPKIGSPI